MRELKFRVWDKAAKRMSMPFSLFGEFTLIGAVHSWQRESGLQRDSIGALNDLIEMEFTGLKDEKGNDVFEGDILRFNPDHRFFNWIVEFNDGCFVIINIGVDGYLGDRFKFESSFFSNREVIGNIYENPELLKTP